MAGRVMTDQDFNPGRALVRLRWDRLTPDQRRAQMRHMTDLAIVANRAAGARRRAEKQAREAAARQEADK
jgi:hypothetical protein